MHLPKHTRFIEHDGKRLTLREWAKIMGMSKQTFINRLNAGFSMDEISELKPHSGKFHARKNDGTRKLYHVGGLPYTLSELSRMTGIELSALWRRLDRGMKIEDALKPGRAKPRPRGGRDGRDFKDSVGTGGGRHAQDGPELAFSIKDLEHDRFTG